MAGHCHPGVRHLDRLTTRERQALALASEGLTNDEIGLRLGFSEQWAKMLMASAMAKTGTDSRINAIQVAAGVDLATLIREKGNSVDLAINQEHGRMRQTVVANHVQGILEELGLDSGNQHFLRTPERFAKVMLAYVQPVDLNEVLSSGFEDDDFSEGVEEANERTLVVQTNIPFMGLCAHHLLPFFGSAAVGYLPRQRVVGLSKLTRLVYAAGHLAPTTQEHITNIVADTLWHNTVIDPKGVAVVTSALHGCMAVRGVEAPATRTVVSVIRGAFKDVPALEAKFMDLAKEGLK